MRALIGTLLILWLVGCKAPQKETPTSGQVEVFVSESHASLLQQEAAEFRRIYPAAEVKIVSATTREAIVRMLNGEATCIVVDRPLNEEEQHVAAQLASKPEETRIGHDGLVVIVNRRNPISGISVETTKRVLQDSIRDWESIKGSTWDGVIELALTGRNSGVYELLEGSLFRLQQDIVPSYLAPSQHDVVHYVASHARALGIVSRGLLREETDTSSIKVLAIAQVDSSSKESLVFPVQESIYHHEYSLHYSLCVYTLAKRSGVANGFIAFLASPPGQKLIMNAGLVPETIPVRTIQLSTQ